MRVNRSYGRRRLPSAIFIFVSVVLVAGLSFIGAHLWQRAETAAAQTRAESNAYHLRYQERGQEALADVQNPPRHTAPETSSATVQTPGVQSPDDQSGHNAFAPGPFAVSWQVAPSAPADISHFDHAIFFADRLGAGLVAYRVVGNAAVVSAVDATTQSALTGQYIITDQGPATMLEAALRYGERQIVYIMLGSDSLHLDPEEFIGGYQDFINAVRAGYPSAVIYIASIPPLGAHAHTLSPGLSNDRVIELNGLIADLARRNSLHFLNLFEVFADEDGYLAQHSSRDGLHLDAFSHFVLLDYLRTHTTGGR